MAAFLNNIIKKLSSDSFTFFQKSTILAAGFACLFFSACNSSSKSTGGTPSPSSGKDTRVVLPSQPVGTPAHINFVYDYEDIFSMPEEKKLDSLVRNFEKSNLIPIRITTIKDPAINAENFDQNNKAILNEWVAMHGKSEKCIAISISKRLRRIRLDYGPFVKRLLSDAEAGSIIENQFKPLFKQDQFYQGTWTGLNALMDTIRKNIRF